MINLSELYTAILLSQNKDEKMLLFLCEKFTPLLKKYSNMLRYDDAYNDLLVQFIEMIYKMPITTGSFVKGDMYILSYIKRSIYNAYVALNKTKENTCNHENTSEDYDYIANMCSDNTDNFGGVIFVLDITNILTQKEYDLFNLKYVYCLSDSEIAEINHVTRQAVNKKLKNIKSKIKDKLYSYL